MTSVFDQVPAPEAVPDDTDVAAEKRSKKRDSLSSTDLRTGRMKLSGLVDLAFNTLESAMRGADWNTATKAAQIVLDRTGFGPKSTMDINTTHVDLSNLTKDQLADRALRIHKMIQGAKEAEIINAQTKKDGLAIVPKLDPITVN